MMMMNEVKESPQRIQLIYLGLMLLTTLAASFIWGVNTLFLLDAGLSNTQAFLVNAFFTLGSMLFEVPTGVVADVRGRRTSFLIGTLVLALSTIFYLLAWQIRAPIWIWAISSIFLGLGFTFFTGATEAWLVDALEYTGFQGDLDSVFAKGQMIMGGAMLSGSVAGGYIAQATNLSVPYILRAGILIVTFVFAFIFMKDLGFKAEENAKPLREMRRILNESIEFGFGNRPVRWLMLASPFSAGVGIYVFYAMQPYMLELYGDETAYGIAGLMAAIVAGAQIVGGISVSLIRKFFAKKTTILLMTSIFSVFMLLGIGLTNNFWVAVILMAIWALMFSASTPIRQSYINGLIPSKQRATVLSFDALMSSSGGVVTQPALGRAADVWNYSTSFMIGAAIQVVAVPFIFLSKRERAEADDITHIADVVE
jgi:MFS family permease